MKKPSALLPKIVLILAAVYLLLPFAATLIYSLFTDWSSILPRGFTLRNYTNLFSDPEFWSSMGNTLVLCAVSVLLTIFLLLMAMYVVLVINRRLGRVMQFVCMIPYALQGVILSISVISLYANAPGVLSNRILMLFGAYTILVLPYIYQGIRNSLNTINATMLIQAAELLGCGSFRAYMTVVLPTVLPGILVSALLAESIVFGDFVLSNNIAGNNYQNIQVFLNRRMFTSSGLASAIVVVIFLVVFIITGLVLKFQKDQQKE